MPVNAPPYNATDPLFQLRNTRCPAAGAFHGVSLVQAIKWQTRFMSDAKLNSREAGPHYSYPLAVYLSNIIIY